ncbi:hypothetical protein D9M69_714430 [compost metagenome]
MCNAGGSPGKRSAQRRHGVESRVIEAHRVATHTLYCGARCGVRQRDPKGRAHLGSDFPQGLKTGRGAPGSEIRG